jgi:serine/threonine protein kinase
MAPEIIERAGYDELVDWWSIGVILYEMIVGFPPFMGDSPQEVFANILDHESLLQFPEGDDEVHLSSPCEDFIRNLVTPVSIRLGRSNGFSDLKQHAFLETTAWDKIRTQTPPFVPHV